MIAARPGVPRSDMAEAGTRSRGGSRSPGRAQPVSGRGPTRIVGALLGSTLVLARIACVAPTGGWDVAPLMASEPSLAEIRGHRIGDLVPFPALVGERLWLVSCRFPTRARVSVLPEGESWPDEWGRRTVEALDRALTAVDLVLTSHPGSERAPRLVHRIRVRSKADPPSRGQGLGNTTSDCDVTVESNDPPRVRGVLREARIRLHRVRLDRVGSWQPARDVEWAGAFAHELGHALGFPSHVATGSSLLVREEGRLRQVGRRILDGRPLELPTLSALYRIEPGRLLGEVPLAPETRLGLTGWAARLARLEAIEGASAEGPIARVGDRAARLAWRWPSGRALELDLPRWQAELRAGVPVTGIVRQGVRRSDVGPD